MLIVLDGISYTLIFVIYVVIHDKLPFTDMITPGPNPVGCIEQNPYPTHAPVVSHFPYRFEYPKRR